MADITVKQTQWVIVSCILSVEVGGQLDAAAALLSWQEATEHETGDLLNSGVMGICYMKRRLGGCHYTGRKCNVAVSNAGYGLRTSFIQDERSKAGLLRGFGISGYLLVEYQ